MESLEWSLQTRVDELSEACELLEQVFELSLKVFYLPADRSASSASASAGGVGPGELRTLRDAVSSFFTAAPTQSAQSAQSTQSTQHLLVDLVLTLLGNALNAVMLADDRTVRTVRTDHTGPPEPLSERHTASATGTAFRDRLLRLALHILFHAATTSRLHTLLHSQNTLAGNAHQFLYTVLLFLADITLVYCSFIAYFIFPYWNIS